MTWRMRTAWTTSDASTRTPTVRQTLANSGGGRLGRPGRRIPRSLGCYLPIPARRESIGASWRCPTAIAGLFVPHPVCTLQARLSGVVVMRTAHEPPITEHVFLYSIERGRPSRPSRPESNNDGGFCDPRRSTKTVRNCPAGSRAGSRCTNQSASHQARSPNFQPGISFYR